MDPLTGSRHPAWFAGLLDDVARAFAVTGAGTPGWPAPHPDREPLEEEYSRCPDPGKYRILHARVEAWVQVLTARGAAVVDDVPPTAWAGGYRTPDALQRVRRLRPARADGPALVLATTLVDGEPFGVDVGLSRPGSPTVFLEAVPDCGCDACDEGSDSVLAVLDGWVLTVARGGVLHARSGAAHASMNLDGWESSGSGADAEAWLDGSRPAPAGVDRWVGEAWVE